MGAGQRATDDVRRQETPRWPALQRENPLEGKEAHRAVRATVVFAVPLAVADDDGLPDMRIAYAAGYKSQASANRAFAAAGLSLASYLSVELQSNEKTSDPEGTMLLGFRGVQPNGEEPGNWILHPELREAVRSVL